MESPSSINPYICHFCNNQFDSEIRLPRFPPQCGHSFCQLCIQDKITQNPNVFICPLDQEKYEGNITLDIFKINVQFLEIIKSAHDDPDHVEKINNHDDSVFRTILFNEYSEEPSELPPKLSIPPSSILHHRISENTQNIINNQPSLLDDNDDNFLENNMPQKLISLPKTQQKINICQVHNNKEKDVVCLDCQQVICSFCTLSGEPHNSHKNYPLYKIQQKIQENQTDLKNNINQLQSFLSKGQDSGSQSEVTKQLSSSILEFKNKLFFEIEEYFLEIQKELKKKEKEVKEQAEEIYKNIESDQLLLLKKQEQDIEKQCQQFIEKNKNYSQDNKQEQQKEEPYINFTLYNETPIIKQEFDKINQNIKDLQNKNKSFNFSNLKCQNIHLEKQIHFITQIQEILQIFKEKPQIQLTLPIQTSKNNISGIISKSPKQSLRNSFQNSPINSNRSNNILIPQTTKNSQKIPSLNLSKQSISPISHTLKAPVQKSQRNSIVSQKPILEKNTKTTQSSSNLTQRRLHSKTIMPTSSSSTINQQQQQTPKQKSIIHIKKKPAPTSSLIQQQSQKQQQLLKPQQPKKQIRQIGVKKQPTSTISNNTSVLSNIQQNSPQGNSNPNFDLESEDLNKLNGSFMSNTNSQKTSSSNKNLYQKSFPQFRNSNSSQVSQLDSIQNFNSNNIKLKVNNQILLQYLDDLQQCNRLFSIDLANQNLKDNELISLVRQMQMSQHQVKQLKLVKNKITDKGFQELLFYLSQNDTVEHLNLTQNQITSKSLDYIIENLQENQTLKTITLYQNNSSLLREKQKIKDIKNKFGIDVQVKYG